MPDPAPLRLVNSVFKPYSNNCSLEYHTIKPTEECRFPGVDNELLHKILTYCNISYELHTMQEFSSDIGHPTNDSSGSHYTGILGLIENGTLDMWTDKWGLTKTRMDSFQFTHLEWEFNTVFVLRKVESTVWQVAMAIFKVYTLETYLVTILCAALLMTLLTVIDVHLYGFGNPIVSLFKCKGLEPNSEKCKGKVPNSRNATIVLLSALVIIMTGLYQGVLLTTLFKPRVQHKLSVDRLLELVDNRAISIIMPNSAYYFGEEILVSEANFFKRLRVALIDNPIVFEDDEEKLMELLETGDYMLPTSWYQAVDYVRTRCALDIVKLENIMTVPKAYMVSKRSQLDLAKFNNCSSQFQGFSEQRHKVYDAEADRESPCFMERMKRRNTQFLVRELNIPSLLGCFAILGLGSAISLVIMVLEVLSHRKALKAVKKVEKSASMVPELGRLSVPRVSFDGYHSQRPSLIVEAAPNERRCLCCDKPHVFSSISS